MSISVGSVAVDVVPSVRGFATKLKAELKNVVAHIGIDGDTARLRASLDEATRDRITTIRAQADTSAAVAQLDAAAHDRTATIRANSSGLGQVRRGVSGITTAVLALGPALIPLTAAVGGLGLALGAPIAAAGGGLTIFGLIAGTAVASTKKQQKEIDALAKKVTQAKTSLATTNTAINASIANSSAAAQRSAANSLAAAQAALSRATTPAGKAAAERRIAAAQASLAAKQAGIQASADTRRAAAQAKVTAATAAYDAALKKLTPAQSKFLASQADLKDSFKSLVASSGNAIFGPLIKGMDLLAGIMPKLSPLLTGVGTGIAVLLNDLGNATKGPGFTAFMRSFGTDAKNAIITFGRIFGNFAQGLFGLFEAFTPLSLKFSGGLTRMSESFKRFGLNAESNQGVQRFSAYVQKIGPKVVDTIGSIIKAIVQIGVALAPLGGAVLGGLKVFADTIQRVPVSVIKGIATAVVSLVLAFKGYAVIRSASLALDRLAASATANRFLPGEFSRLKTAVRGLSGAAGLGLMVAAADSTNGALNTLGTIGGGAMLGFSLGGPIGGAIGAGAGGLYSLFRATRRSTKEFAEAKPVIGEYIATLDELTGATTRQTRAEALNSLRQSGALAAAQSLGIDAKVAIDAALGNKKAIARIEALRQELLISLRPPFEPGSGTKQQVEAIVKLTDALGANADAFARQRREALVGRLALLPLGKAIDAIPDRTLIRIGTEGAEKAKLDLAKLAIRRDLADGDVKSLIKVLNVPTSLKEIQSVIDRLEKVKSKRVKIVVEAVVPSILAGIGAGGSIGVSPEGAGATGAIIRRPTVLLAGEAGPEALMPLNQTPGNSPLPGGGLSGPQIVVEQVVAQDVNHLLAGLQQRARHASLDGISR